MKKLLSILILSAMVISNVACSAQREKSKDADDDSSTTKLEQSMTSKDNYYMAESDIQVVDDEVSIVPKYVYWDKNELVAVCVVTNGYDKNITVRVDDLTLENDNGIIAKSSFGSIIVMANSKTENTFRFSGEYIQSYNANLTDLKVTYKDADFGGNNTDVSTDVSENDQNDISKDDEVSDSTHHSHSYVSQITKTATCLEDGIKTFTCKCGDSYTEKISATGHLWGEWAVYKEATTSAEGESRRLCEKCGDYESKTIEKLQSTEQNVFWNPDNIVDENDLTVRPRYVYWDNGALVAECFVINGTDNVICDINVKKLTFSNDSGEIASASFGILSGLILQPNSYVVWTFKFNVDTVKKTNAYIASTLNNELSYGYIDLSLEMDNFASSALNTFTLTSGNKHKPTAAAAWTNKSCYTSNSAVVTVAENGTVTAVGKGIAFVIVKAKGTNMYEVYKYIVK